MATYTCRVCERGVMGMPDGGEFALYEVCSQECLEIEKGLEQIHKKYLELNETYQTDHLDN